MEKFDLNSLKSKIEEAPKQEKSVEARIAELRALIAQLEDEASILDRFLGLSDEEKQAKIDEMNSGLPEDDKYTIETYAQELSSSKGPSLKSLRLGEAKRELEDLIS